ncbi:NAD dependent epimerase/dehydratase family protein [Hypoxylon rubiginosum]|uniref:NAD dependent epimerase/dehydratase family protein n=1 Tax=Hypoxylon rubiginosum TaxID=110542 RepID=A0ACC0D1W8_9PEZI|nr:NAD dependent epimerase/dehydratase family protein [Hypoxylon rubiginosum]
MASASTSFQVLLTGATGYIGGSILTKLLASPSPIPDLTTISCLLRGVDRAEKLTSAYGDRVRPIIYKDIDDIEATVAAAAQHDIVINTTLGFHPASAQALLRGLSQRKAQTGRDVWYIQTSGTSNVADRPFSKAWVEPAGREFDDAKDDIYGYEKDREVREAPYPQRTTELGVVDTGLELGIKTLVIMSPLIFGKGTGLFNVKSIGIPGYARSGLKHGRAVMIADGKTVWDHVHVEDLVDLYVIILSQITEKGGEGVPTGKKGIIFSGNGRHEWREVVQGVAEVLYEEGKVTNPEPESMSLTGAAKVLTLIEGLDFASHEKSIERVYASNARTVSSVGRSLGWKPTRGDDVWKKAIRSDTRAFLEEL